MLLTRLSARRSARPTALSGGVHFPHLRPPHLGISNLQLLVAQPDPSVRRLSLSEHLSGAASILGRARRLRSNCSLPARCLPSNVGTGACLHSKSQQRGHIGWLRTGGLFSLGPPTLPPLFLLETCALLALYPLSLRTAAHSSSSLLKGTLVASVSRPFVGSSSPQSSQHGIVCGLSPRADCRRRHRRPVFGTVPAQKGRLIRYL